MVGRQQIGDEEAAASARLELLNALDDLDMGPQPAASSTPTRLPRRLNLGRNPSVTFTSHTSNPLIHSPHVGGGAQSPFHPLAPATSMLNPLTSGLSGLPPAEGLQQGSALERLPGLPDRRQSLRRCSSLREQTGPLRSPFDGSGASPAQNPAGCQASAIFDPTESMPQIEPHLKGAAGPGVLGAPGHHMQQDLATNIDPGPAGGIPGEAGCGQSMDQSITPQMPRTPDQTCSEDGSPQQPQVCQLAGLQAHVCSVCPHRILIRSQQAYHASRQVCSLAASPFVGRGSPDGLVQTHGQRS